MWSLVSRGAWLHGHEDGSLGKNFILYSSIGAWLVISLVTWVHSELERLKCLSHVPPFEYEGCMGLSSLSLRSRKFFPL